MVKVTFNSSFGQKEPKKPTSTDEALIPERDLEEGPRVRHQSKAWCWCMCLGLALMLSGVVVGGAYLYKSYMMQEAVYFCGVDYREQDYMVQEEEVEEEAGLPARLRHLQESIRVLEEEEVELISVPVPEFSDSDPADIVHDFHRRLTAYLDLSLNKCYVTPLNTSIVMPPKDFLELLINIKARTYLPQSYLVHEQMVVTERLDNVEELGFFIYSMCRGKDTYRLERRVALPGIRKRAVESCLKIRHFENEFVVETKICQPS